MRLDYEGMKKIVNFARVLEKGKASKGVSNQEEDFLQYQHEEGEGGWGDARQR